ncbi:MAG: hypothetical protein ABR976_19230 [Terracidiphilus sp.]|jgi:hypothetical protein
MRALINLCLGGLVAAPLALAQPIAPAQQAPTAPLPEIPQLMREVQEHQKLLERVRENYTYTSMQTTQDIDSNGQVKKTESQEGEDFFVNGHVIERTVKKDGKPLDDHDQQKETERVTKLVEKAQKTPSDQPLEGQTISVSRILAIMDVRNARRETYRGRAAIVFDFIGRKDAKTHGLAEDASKKLEGTIWIDESDRQVAHLEVRFIDNFRVAGGLVATIDKGSTFRFDQTLVNGEVWLPTGAEANLQARVLLVKGYRQHFTESDYDFKRFHVDAEQMKDAKPTAEKQP